MRKYDNTELANNKHTYTVYYVTGHLAQEKGRCATRHFINKRPLNRCVTLSASPTLSNVHHSYRKPYPFLNTTSNQKYLSLCLSSNAPFLVRVKLKTNNIELNTLISGPWCIYSNYKPQSKTSDQINVNQTTLKPHQEDRGRTKNPIREEGNMEQTASTHCLM